MKFCKILLIITLMPFSFAHAIDEDVTCGSPPGLVARFLTDAEDIYLKCLDDLDKRNRERVLKEVHELQEVSRKLDQEIKSTAVNYSASLVTCTRQGRDPKLVTSWVGRKNLSIDLHRICLLSLLNFHVHQTMS